MAFELPPLPYSRDALAPHLSEETFDYHYGKHHKAYVDKTNAAIEGTDLADKSLLEVIKAAKSKGDQGLFNNSAQVWNHTFYWHSMSPNGGGEPSGRIGDMINAAFGSYDKFKDDWKSKGTGNFASGWTWLCENGDGKLEIVNTDDADTPVVHDGMKPLLTMDVWEHAYYLDRQNDRGTYVDHFFDVIDWDFVDGNLDKAEADLIG
ncbi:MAG: superoxide dismutase [Pacificimonas sp.]|jgi:Fe-Mn family superoxide dismutase|nr:superoxide dismutase [Pacificimonas sp.]